MSSAASRFGAALTKSHGRTRASMQATSFTFSTHGMTRRASDSSDPSNDSVLALTEGERRFLAALVELGVPFLVVGVGSAALQGARVVTEDIDLWFKDRTDRRIGDAAARFGGVFVAGHFGMMPPQVILRSYANTETDPVRAYEAAGKSHEPTPVSTAWTATTS